MRKSPRLVSASMAAPGIVNLAWDDGMSCALDLSADLPAGIGGPRVEDWGYSLAFDGTDLDFGSPDLYKRAAWQEGHSPAPAAFRAWRKKVNLTQDQLASLFDIGRRTVGYYEDGTLLVPRVVALAMKGYEAERSAAE